MDRPRRRKLLAASLGVAAVSYVVGVACDGMNVTSGNLPGPPPSDARDDQQNVISGNLPAPPPPDASQEDGGDAGDGGDASDAATDDASDASSD